MSIGEDWDLFTRLAARYHFVVVTRLGILYRVSPDSATSSNLLRLGKGCLEVLDKTFQQAPESLQHLKKYRLAVLYKYFSSKAIEGTLLTKDRGLLALRYYWQAFQLDRSILKQRIDYTFFTYLKIVIAITLPSKLTQSLISRCWSLFWRSRPELYSPIENTSSIN